jgi:hypothetical protein
LAAVPGRRTLAEMIADNGHEGRSDLVLPDVLEVSWVRRADYEGRSVPLTESFPTDDDQLNLAHRPDLFLG